VLVYNAFAFLGCVAAIFVLLKNRPPLIPAWHRVLLPLSIFVLSRFAARFLYAIESGAPIQEWPYYFSFGPGSTSQFAGLYGSVLLLAGYAALRRASPLALLDALVPAAPIAIAFGRLGCLFAGCCPGLLLPFRWTRWSAIPNPYNLPAPLAEGASALLLFWLLRRLVRRPLPTGYRTGYFLLFHGASRFLLQFIRIEPVRWGFLTSTQALAIPLIVAGAVLLDRHRAARLPAAIDQGLGLPARARG
jgi:prolipoprotein diacylglyceryltransferase